MVMFWMWMFWAQSPLAALEGTTTTSALVDAGATTISNTTT